MKMRGRESTGEWHRKGRTWEQADPAVLRDKIQGKKDGEKQILKNYSDKHVPGYD